MKKVFSIVFALLILFSGMHLTLATHICGGEVAAMKLSCTGKRASCGMETNNNDVSSSNSIHSNCCHDKLASYSVDKNYNPSTCQLKQCTVSFIQAYYIPVSLTQNSKLKTQNSTVFPPGNLLATNVSLNNICVFRI